jgi:hypothetical protein
MPLFQTATNTFRTGLANAAYNFTSDTFKIALYTGAATLNETTTTYTTTNEVVAGGYTAGGATLTVSTTPTTGNSGNVMYLSFNNVSWSGAITARGALIYKFNGTTNPSVCVLDFGGDKSSSSTFQVQFPAATNTSAIIRVS